MDYTVGDTLYFLFTTRRFSTGAPFILAGTPVISAYENEGLTQITAGVTLGVDHDTVAGLNLVTVVASGANGFETSKHYHLVITTGTVDGVSVVGEVVANFTLERTASFARLGAPAGASVSADIAAIEAQTDDIGVAGAGLTGLANIVWNEDATAHQTLGTFGQAIGDPVADANTIYGAVVTGATGATIAADIITIDDFLDTEVAAILEDTGTTLDDFIDTEIATIITDIAAVKADTAAILVDTGTDGVALAAGAITSTKFAAGAIDTAAVGAGVVGAVDKNAAFSNFEFLMVDSTDHVTPKTGLVVTGTRSIDGGAFAAVTGTIAEVANGIYQFDALAADTNGDLITWRFISATADDVFVTFRTVA
jgi:hypothetical protein